MIQLNDAVKTRDYVVHRVGWLVGQKLVGFYCGNVMSDADDVVEARTPLTCMRCLGRLR